jgi:hypothetical protein
MLMLVLVLNDAVMPKQKAASSSKRLFVFCGSYYARDLR